MGSYLQRSSAPPPPLDLLPGMHMQPATGKWDFERQIKMMGNLHLQKKSSQKYRALPQLLTIPNCMVAQVKGSPWAYRLEESPEDPYTHHYPAPTQLLFTPPRCVSSQGPVSRVYTLNSLPSRTVTAPPPPTPS